MTKIINTKSKYKDLMQVMIKKYSSLYIASYPPPSLWMILLWFVWSYSKTADIQVITYFSDYSIAVVERIQS